jgi:hypothetical protein
VLAWALSLTNQTITNHTNPRSLYAALSRLDPRVLHSLALMQLAQADMMAQVGGHLVDWIRLNPTASYQSTPTT